jgi:hypothetical protein
MLRVRPIMPRSTLYNNKTKLILDNTGAKIDDDFAGFRINDGKLFETLDCALYWMERMANRDMQAEFPKDPSLTTHRKPQEVTLKNGLVCMSAAGVNPTPCIQTNKLVRPLCKFAKKSQTRLKQKLRMCEVAKCMCRPVCAMFKPCR